MVAYNFQKQFAAAVQGGDKTQTIRAVRKRHAMVGERLQLYTGMRTKSCCKLVMPDPTCSANKRVLISSLGASVDRQIVEDLDAFAQQDGFENYHQMLKFFDETHGLPFVGRLIEWELADG